MFILPRLLWLINSKNKILKTKEKKTKNSGARTKGLRVGCFTQHTHCIGWPGWSLWRWEQEQTSVLFSFFPRLTTALFWIYFSPQGAVRSHTVYRVDGLQGLRGKIHAGRFKLMEHGREKKGLFSPIHIQKISWGSIHWIKARLTRDLRWKH